MSLVAFALRVAAARAIEAVIWPEFPVRDSPQRPLDLLEEGRPLIALYTGRDVDRIAGRDLYGGEPKVSLTIQVFLPATVTVTVAGQPLVLDTREAGAETVLDVIDRRILGALLGQAEPWSQLVFGLVQNIKRTASNSYLVETEKMRTAAREITLTCETIHEPIPGAAPADIWADLAALMRTDTAGSAPIAALADWIAAEIAGPAALTAADRDRIDLGLSIYAAQRVGILPVVEDTADDAPAWAAAIDETSCDPAAPAPDGYAIATEPAP